MASTIVLITGANSGIGYAASKVTVCASKSFHVIMTGRSLEKVQKAKSDIEQKGIQGSLSALQLDVTDEKSVERAVTHVDQTYGRLDALVNIAAVGNRESDVKTRFQQCMDVNVVGPAVVAAAFRSLLLKSQKPYSIYVSSGAGSMGRAADPASPMYRNPFPYAEAYRVSKAALNMMALQDSIESSESALKIFALCPGFMRSNLRGTSEAEISGWGGAEDAEIAGNFILDVIEGKRDADAGKFVKKDGLHPW